MMPQDGIDQIRHPPSPGLLSLPTGIPAGCLPRHPRKAVGEVV